MMLTGQDKSVIALMPRGQHASHGSSPTLNSQLAAALDAVSLAAERPCVECSCRQVHCRSEKWSKAAEDPHCQGGMELEQVAPVTQRWLELGEDARASRPHHPQVSRFLTSAALLTQKAKSTPHGLWYTAPNMH